MHIMLKLMCWVESQWQDFWNTAVRILEFIWLTGSYPADRLEYQKRMQNERKNEEVNKKRIQRHLCQMQNALEISTGICDTLHSLLRFMRGDPSPTHQQRSQMSEGRSRKALHGWTPKFVAQFDFQRVNLVWVHMLMKPVVLGHAVLQARSYVLWFKTNKSEGTDVIPMDFDTHVSNCRHVNTHRTELRDEVHQWKEVFVWCDESNILSLHCWQGNFCLQFEFS